MENPEKIKNAAPWWRDGIIAFLKVSVSIALPIIIALYLGKYLDTKYNSEPWIFLGLTFVAFAISLFSIWRNMLKYMKEIDNIPKK